MNEWHCPKCGCSHELEKGLHERWGCYLDDDSDDPISRTRTESNSDELHTKGGNMTTVYIANVLPIDAARIAQTLGLSGTVSDALGFGEWGVEPTTVVSFGNMCFPDVDIALFISEVFTQYPDEDAVYIEPNGLTIHRDDLVFNPVTYQ